MVSRGKWVSQLLALIYYICILFFPVMLLCISPLWFPIYISLTIVAKILHSTYSYLKKFRFFSMVSPTSPLHYAVLKGNGKYIKSNAANCLAHQFYDYSSRSNPG